MTIFRAEIVGIFSPFYSCQPIQLRRMKPLKRILPWVILAVYWPLLFTTTHIPRLPDLQVLGRDVTLHFCAYLILTLLFWLARYGARRPSITSVPFYWTLLLMMVYAAVDEFTQSFVGRHGDPIDWCSDVAGTLAALILLAVVRRARHWLMVYWLAFFVVTHWPQKDVSLITLPDPWGQYQLFYLFLAYLILTFLWFRSISPQARFVVNRTILSASLFVLPTYTLLDEFISFIMQRGFHPADIVVGLSAILLGSLCSMALAQHHVSRDAYPAPYDPAKLQEPE